MGRSEWSGIGRVGTFSGVQPAVFRAGGSGLDPVGVIEGRGEFAAGVGGSGRLTVLICFQTGQFSGVLNLSGSAARLSRLTGALDRLVNVWNPLTWRERGLSERDRDREIHRGDWYGHWRVSNFGRILGASSVIRFGVGLVVCLLVRILSLPFARMLLQRLGEVLGIG